MPDEFFIFECESHDEPDRYIAVELWIIWKGTYEEDFRCIVFEDKSTLGE